MKNLTVRINNLCKQSYQFCIQIFCVGFQKVHLMKFIISNDLKETMADIKKLYKLWWLLYWPLLNRNVISPFSLNEIKPFLRHSICWDCLSVLSIFSIKNFVAWLTEFHRESKWQISENEISYIIVDFSLIFLLFSYYN